MVKISIVIPMYNVEQYIERCLYSVLNQTLTDIEVICIDDNSSDKTYDLAQKISNLDQRVKLIKNQQNIGAASSRNKGVSISDGEYIWFVDADDYIENDVLRKMYDIASSGKLDVLRVRYSVCSCLEKVECDFRYPEEIENIVSTGEDILVQLVRYGKFSWGICTNFYKSELLKRVTLDGTLVYGEDTLLAIETLCLSSKVMCINDLVYCYNVANNQSVISARRGEKYFSDHINILKKILLLAEDNKQSSALRAALMDFGKFFYRNTIAGGINIKKYALDDRIVELKFGKYENDSIKTKYEQNILSSLSLCKSRSVYIYGAGKIASLLIEELIKMGIRIDAVMVSNKSEKDEHCGYRVVNVSDFNDLSESIVITALSDRNLIEVIPIFKKNQKEK